MYTFPNHPIIPTKTLVFDDTEFLVASERGRHVAYRDQSPFFVVEARTEQSLISKVVKLLTFWKRTAEPKWQCTRCGFSDVEARSFGCDRAPCPMDLIP